ncbi:DMT family transporter [Azospirillum himalayense]|uniref:DMT family transporter n=1 Tax=Azospirillum himalayense TaxID=654847 RepID=A0ABW0G7L4_9PROT
MIGATTGPERRRGVIAATLAALCWGAATVLSKTALEDLPPVSLLVLQLAASVALLWTVVGIRRTPSNGRRDILGYAWLGLLEPGLAYLLGLIGLAGVQAGGAVLIQSSEAIMIVCASAILLRVRPGGRFVGLSLVAFSGLTLALGLFRPEDAAGNDPIGVTLIFAATATAAVYVVLSSRVAAQADPIMIVAWQQTVALVFALLLLPADWLLAPQGPAFPRSAGLWLVVVASGILQYALAFSLYMLALRAISANVAGSFLNLTPVFGLAIAFLFLGETLSPVQLTGTAVTLAAVIMIGRLEPGDAH